MVLKESVCQHLWGTLIEPVGPLYPSAGNQIEVKLRIMACQIGVGFDAAVPGGISLNGACPAGHGFFCTARQLAIESGRRDRRRRACCRSSRCRCAVRLHHRRVAQCTSRRLSEGICLPSKLQGSRYAASRGCSAIYSTYSEFCIRHLNSVSNRFGCYIIPLQNWQYRCIGRGHNEFATYVVVACS